MCAIPVMLGFAKVLLHVGLGPRIILAFENKWQ